MAEFISTYGLTFVFVNVLLDQVGLPVPALPTLILAGALAADGKLSTPALLAVAIGATLLTEVAWFHAGRRYGNHIMKTLCRISLTPDLCVQQTQTMFERWGINALLFANFIPGLSVIAPPLAGAVRTPWPKFLLLSITGATLWIGTGVGLGMIFRGQIKHILAFMTDSGSTVFAVIAILLAAYIAYKWEERRRFFAMLRMARISPDELYQLMSGEAVPVIVDVRSQTARSLEPRQIPGARHLPLHAIPQHIEGLPRDRDVIFYCTSVRGRGGEDIDEQRLQAGASAMRRAGIVDRCRALDRGNQGGSFRLTGSLGHTHLRCLPDRRNVETGRHARDKT